MTIRKAGVWCNRDKEEALHAAERLIGALDRNGISVGLDDALRVRLGRTDAEALDGSDMLITLGGDGTLLSGLDEAMRMDVPMLGVNLGHVGFLTEIEPDQMEEAVARIAAGDYREDRRLLLRADGYDRDGLNDVTLTRAQTSTRILAMSVYADGRMIQRFSGDGLIIATPTGSTGYSMSAGGPLVVPGVEMMLLTPVCAHTPHAKPVVVPASAHIEVQLSEECEAVLAMDGRYLDTLPAGGCVGVRRAERKARFVRLKEDDFFGRLKSKLLDWGR